MTAWQHGGGAIEIPVIFSVYYIVRYTFDYFCQTNNTTTFTFQNLEPGDYSVSVENPDGCISEETVVVLNEPDQLESIISTNNVSCYQGNDGSIEEITVIGGTPPYNTENISELSAGTYYTTIIDSYGCELISEFSISEPAEIVTSFVVENILCNGSATN